ncbi:unnamed protein product [Lampetra fluviatilis]
MKSEGAEVVAPASEECRALMMEADRLRLTVADLTSKKRVATSGADAAGDEPQSRAGMMERPPAVGVPALETTRSGAAISREETRPPF